MGARRIDRDFRPLVEAAMKQGWELRDGTRHAQLVAPDGRVQPIPGSASDHRAVKNFRAQLRRLGVSV